MHWGFITDQANIRCSCPNAQVKDVNGLLDEGAEAAFDAVKSLLLRGTPEQRGKILTQLTKK